MMTQEIISIKKYFHDLTQKIIFMTHIKSEYFHDSTQKIIFMTHIKSEYFHDST